MTTTRRVSIALVAAGAVALPTAAVAYDFGAVNPTTPGTTMPLPSGGTVTITGTGATAITAPAEGLSARSAVSANFTPQIGVTNAAFRPLVTTGTCPGASPATGTVICSGLGTMVLTFSRPVTNPVLHVAGLGASFGATGNYVLFHATGTLSASVPAGATLGPARAGATNLQIVGNQFRAINDSANTSCASAGAETLATAGCGSFQVNGTVTSLTFNIGARMYKSSAGFLAPSATSGDVFNLTVTVPQDMGDAPATYDAAGAAVHDMTDLKLGASVDEEAATTANPTASPNAAASGAAPTGDGADEDALTTWPSLTTAAAGSTYSVTVPVSGTSSPSRLCGYIDWDRSGTFATGSEMACANVAAGATSGVLTWNVPTATAAGPLYARLRLGYGAAQVETPTGRADSGEVEDYRIAMMPAIRVVKNLVGGGASTFDLKVNGTTMAAAVGNAGTTGTLSVYNTATFGTPSLSVAQDVTTTAIPLTIAESATAGNQVLYTSTYSCVDGTGATVASGSGTSGTAQIPRSLGTNAQQQSIICTFTNTPIPAAITIDKVASAITDLDANGADAGDRITYTFTVTNSGGYPLTGVSVSDPILTGAGISVNCPSATLALGASMACTASGPYTLTQANVDAGVANNTATASGTPPTGPAVTGTDSTSVTITPNGAMRVDKTAGAIVDLDGNGQDTGDTITYSFIVTNTGNVTLTSVALSDPSLGGAITCPKSTLAPGEPMSCTATTYTITAGDFAALSHTNTASTTGTTPAGATVSDTDATTTTIVPTPKITLDKTAGTINDLDANGPDAGDTIVYAFSVTNAGTTSLSSVSISDPLVGAVTCPTTTLAAGASMSCNTVTYTITATDVTNGGVINNAGVTGTPPSGPAVTGNDSTSTTITAIPGIALDKTAAPIVDVDGNGIDPGDTIEFTFVITNTGGSTLTSVGITDSMVTVSCSGNLLSGNSRTCTAIYTLSAADIDAGAVNNTATASGKTGAVDVSSTDSTSTAIPANPGVAIDKTSSAINDLDGNGPDPGDTIVYGFTVTNTGNVTLTGVSVSDPLLGAVSCPKTTLNAGEPMSCTAITYTLLASDVDAGTRANTATVTATTPSGTDITKADSTSTAITRTPAIAIDKTASAINDLDTNGPDAGDTIVFGFTVTNTGNVTLTGVGVSDPLLGAVSCPTSTLNAGASMSCTAITRTLDQTDVDSGAVNNTASVTGTPPAGAGAAVTAADSTSTTIAPGPAITLAKTAGAIADTDGNGPDQGDTVPYTFVVTNTGNVTLSGIVLTDPLLGTITCPAATLAPGASMTCTVVNYPLTQANVDAGSVDSTAVVTGTPPTGPAVVATDNAPTSITRTPGVSVDKVAGAVVDLDGNGRDIGDTITFTFAVTNTGNVTLTNLTLNDPLLGGAVTCPTTPLAPGASTTCTATTYTLTQADVDAGAVNNTAFIGATAPTGASVSASDSTSTAVAATGGLALDKVAGAVNDLDVNGVDVGDTIVYGFTVKNTGNVTLTNVSVTDPLLGAVTCPRVTLAPGVSMVCTAITYVLKQSDVDAGSRANTATAKGTTPSNTTLTTTDSTTTALAQVAEIRIDKTATPITDLDGNGQDAGDRVTYGFTVTNTGNVTMSAVSVSDPMLGTVTCPKTTLAPGESMSCTSINYSLTQAKVDAGLVENLARVGGTPPASAGPRVYAEDVTSTPITATPALSLNKTAGSLNDVDGNGDDAGDMITYTFAVTNTGNVTLTALSLNDPLLGGAITCPTGALAPGATVNCTATSHVVTSTEVDSGEVVNTATITGTPPSGPDVSATDDTTTPVVQDPSITLDKSVVSVDDVDTNGRDAGDEVSYSFTVTNTGNVSLTSVAITDPLVTGLTCPATTLAAGASMTCTADPHVLTQPEVDSGELTNNATVSGTPPNGPDVGDSASTTTPITPGPSVALNKSASAINDLDGNGPDVGDTITYSFSALNTGTVTLSGITVNDPLVGSVTCPTTALAPNDSLDCDPVTYTLQQADIDAGGRSNAATISAQPPLPAPPVTGGDGTDTPIARTPLVGIDKTMTAFTDVDGNGQDEGDTLTYGIVITNLGNVTLTGIVVTDPVLGPITCPATTLAPGAMMICTPVVVTLTQPMVDSGVVASTATVDATSSAGDVTANDATSTPIGATPVLSVDKTAGAVNDVDGNGPDAGDEITYSFTVSNDGNVTISAIDVTDALLGPVTCPATTLAPGASITCTSITYTLAQSDVNGGVRANAATATGDAPSGAGVTATDNVTRAITRTPAITLDKVADPLVDVDGNGPDTGDTITFSFTVTNSGNISLANIVLSDPMLGPLTCPQSSLEPGESMSCSSASISVTQNDLNVGSVLNTATVTGDTPFATTVTGTDSTTTFLVATPEIAINKTASAITDTDANGPDPGDTITYGFVVTNVGNVSLTNIVVSDPLLGSITCPSSGLNPTETMTCTPVVYTLTLADTDRGARSNTATVSADPPAGAAVSASDTTTTAVVPRAPVIKLTLTGNKTIVKAGGLVTFTLRATNTSTTTAKNLTMCDVLPVGVDVTRLGGGKLSGGKVCWTFTLAPGQSTTRQITVRVDRNRKAGRLTNRATLRGGQTVLRAQRPVTVRPIRTTGRVVVTG